MRSLTLTAPAKINLLLHIAGDRPDGFHELVMVMQSIDLADTVTVKERQEPGIGLSCNSPNVPTDNSNLAWKAADLMQRRFPDVAKKRGGITIDLVKRIPMGAGLAGGSADCAAVLVGIDLLWELGLTKLELQTLAAELGSDISFCVAGGTALCTGRGEIIDPLPGLDHLYAVLAKYEDLPVPTPWAYKTYRAEFGSTYPESTTELDRRTEQLRTGSMMNAIVQGDGAAIGKGLHNDLEKVVLPHYPKIQNLRNEFSKTNSLGVMMSGSGSTVFALAQSLAQAEIIEANLRSAIPDSDLEFWITKFCHSGVQLIDSLPE
jgi:4-diphosphocytidyl-2-C-methyl-D-erythritol kinase